MSDQETARVARRLTQHERARVWERVVAERAKGDGWRDIAERAALSERQCRRIYLAYARSAPRLERSVLEREIEETVAFYDQAVSDLAVISMTTRSELLVSRRSRRASPRAPGSWSCCVSRAPWTAHARRSTCARSRTRSGWRSTSTTFRTMRDARCSQRCDLADASEDHRSWGAQVVTGGRRSGCSG